MECLHSASLLLSDSAWCGIFCAQDPHPQLLVMGAALMCSGAMGLPVSGFPNMTAIGKEDPTGNPWLTSADFFKVRPALLRAHQSGLAPQRPVLSRVSS